MKKFDHLKPAYSIDELLNILPLGRTKLHSEINKGRLKATKLGKKTIFLAEDVSDYLESLPSKAAK